MHVLVVSAGGSKHGDDLRAIAAEDEHECTGLEADFRAGLEVVERSDDFRDVAGALVFFVIGKKAGRAIAEVGYFLAAGLQAFDDPTRTQSAAPPFPSPRKTRRPPNC